jgi:hypothetical protein
MLYYAILDFEYLYLEERRGEGRGREEGRRGGEASVIIQLVCHNKM